MKLQAALLLGVTFICSSTADFAPPVVNISLDEAAYQRWAPLKDLYDLSFLRKAAAQVIDTTVPRWVHIAVKPIVRALEKYIPQPYAEEIRGMAAFYGSDIVDIVLLNFAYEVSAFCTSIVAQDAKGNIYHGRNLDYPHDVLKNLTIDVLFTKNGKVAYRGTTFAGYVGLWTGQSPNRFTVSGNERNKGHWWENIISAILLKSSPVSWLVRETLEAALDFQDAVMRLAKVPIITDVYYIVGGVRAGEGVVITRDRSGSDDIWPLDPLYGKEVAMKALNVTGQNNITMSSLYEVLSVNPVCNRITVYTTVMSAATPENYTTVVRDDVNDTDGAQQPESHWDCGSNKASGFSLIRNLSGGQAMGCGVTKTGEFNRRYDKDGNVISAARSQTENWLSLNKLRNSFLCDILLKAMKAAVLIQRWYKQYVARLEVRRRYTWNIFQSMEYADQQDQIKLYNFLGYLVDNFTPSSRERNLISHIFRENEVCRDAEWERYFSYNNIDVPDIYSGPRPNFPLDMDQVADLVEAFKNKQQQLHSRYVLQLLLETWKLLRVLPNINRVSTCHSKEITICGDLHGQLEDLLLIFYKNGMPSMEKPYVFNGDYVDRGKDSMEILLILYGFTKEVLGKYKLHGKRILKLLQKIFSWLPLATVIDQRVFIVHGGISDSTDLSVIARADRHKYVSALRPPQKRTASRSSLCTEPEHYGEMLICQNRRGSLAFPKTFGPREGFQRRSLQDFSKTLSRTMEEELEVRRRQAEFSLSGYSRSHHVLSSNLSSESEPEPSEYNDPSSDEWKQILDLLWSDPMPKEGCVPNEVRGGGCYWGPDITEAFLNKNHLQLIIRSHECKQDGYEYCHNRKVLTLFSASNYYEIGSNRGAFVRLGPDLVPYFVQYQANSLTRGLSFPQSVRRTEHTALRVLREELFAHKSDLLSAFQALDKEKKGKISLNDWVKAVEQVLHLDLPWRILHPQLVSTTSDGMVDYNTWFRDLGLKKPSSEVIEQSMLETLYRHRSTLETIFRIVDTDNSGFISFEDFRQTLKLLSVYLKMEISDEVINELVISTDRNNDGSIDIDEFMEAFRLVDKSRLERGKSMLQLRQDIHRLHHEEEESSRTADSIGPRTSLCPPDPACAQTTQSPASQTADCQSSPNKDLLQISVVVPQE
ncbi:hypothetical protein DNTS_021391 [Danionella cerebrum]|uniref:protein-serine/threonine phosphatase n=1 Tax=Danionella cerebrum TaxID=2873325 RepID=A0A553R115_9TELE|nr:hypothetical protein DNTS_021391 [Danionella translucida]